MMFKHYVALKCLLNFNQKGITQSKILQVIVKQHEALQASATISVPQRLTNFCSMVGKKFWINFGTQWTLRHTAFRIFIKKLWFVIIVFPSDSF